MNLRSVFSFNIILIFLSGCSLMTYKPFAAEPYLSEATEEVYNQNSESFPAYTFKGFNEHQVLKIKITESKSFKKSSELAEQINNLRRLTGKKSPIVADINTNGAVPGGLFITENFYIDEIEATNLNWLEYLYYLKRDSSEAAARKMLPDLNLIPLVPQDIYTIDITGFSPEYLAKENKDLRLDTYLEHPAYRYYPVVGITHQQAKAYCKWRSKYVTQSIHKRFPEKRHLSFNYRLPTEKEWELVASAGMDIEKYPYALYSPDKIKIHFSVNPSAAEFLYSKVKNPPSKSQLETDIKKFNRLNSLKPEEMAFNTKRELPYFLNFATPFYVFGYPMNDFGAYGMIGNVAEMVAEEGVAKGGSWLEPLSNSKITDRKLYDKPAADIGFRCVCEVEKIK